MFGPKFVTLVFTDTSIRVARAAPSSKGVKISYVAKKNLPPATVFNGRIINENLFRESLKSLYLETYDQLKTKNLVLGLNEQESFVTSLSFAKKPKDLQKNIEQYLINKLPFDLSKASIHYKEVSPATFQIIAARREVLELLSGIFVDTGFKLKAIVPIPLLFPAMVGKQEFPYLVVSSGEDLSFLLVVKNTIVFSSTIKLKAKLSDSDKEIIRLAKEIIEEEYSVNNQEPLRNVYIFGSNAAILKTFFTASGFNTRVIAAASASSKQDSYDISEFGRCIALSFYTSSILAFPFIGSTSKPKEGLSTNKKGGWFKYVLYLLFVLLILGLGYFFRSEIEDLFFSRENKGAESTKQTTPPTLPKPKESTPSAELEATPSTQPKKEPTVNKGDYKIRVLNGSGKAGAASSAKTYLESRDYVVASMGNADSFNYQKTEIRLKKSKQLISNLLTKDLKERYAITVGSNLAESEPYDVLIILGGE